MNRICARLFEHVLTRNILSIMFILSNTDQVAVRNFADVLVVLRVVFGLLWCADVRRRFHDCLSLFNKK